MLKTYIYLKFINKYARYDEIYNIVFSGYHLSACCF